MFMWKSCRWLEKIVLWEVLLKNLQDRIYNSACHVNLRGGLVVRVSASRAEGRGFDLRLRQTNVFKTDSSGFPPWRSGLWEYHNDWPASVRIMD